MKLRPPKPSVAARGVCPIVLLASASSLVMVGLIFAVNGWLDLLPRNGWGVLIVIAMAAFLHSLLVITLLSARLERRFLEAISALNRAGRRALGIKESALDCAIIDDDPDQLRHAFNALLDQLHEHEHELASVRANTEQRVEERTQHLMRAKEAAEEANQLKSQFLANISHELRTPLHAILSFSRFGVEKSNRVGPDKLIKYFENINESGNRLLVLLNDLLDLAKLEAGKMNYAFRSDDLLQIVHTSIEEFRCLAAEKQCSLQLGEGVSATVQIDRKTMLQVVRNVLSNAIKFSPDGGTIHLRVRKVDGAATVEIRDEGQGIPEEDLDGIFEKFVQARNISSDAGGTGLGLAICREIVKAHNGDIWVYNHRDGGAVFVFSVPLYTPSANSKSAEVSSVHEVKGPDAERSVEEELSVTPDGSSS